MAITEAEVKRKIVREVRKEGGYARRMEDKYTVGMPDVLILMPDSPVFIAEVKVFDHLSFAPTPRQLEEMTRMSISYALCPIMIGYKLNKYYFCYPKETVSVIDCVFTQNNETFVETLNRWWNGQVAKVIDIGKSWNYIQRER